MAKKESQDLKETMVTLLVKQVAIPKNAKKIRLAGAGNSRPSGMANPFVKPPLNWSTPPALVQQVLPADEAVVFVTNDPLHAAIFTDKNPTAVLLQQLWLFSGSPDNAVITVAPGQTPPLDNDLFCSVPLGGAKAWHGPRLYPWLHKGKYYMWCDSALVANPSNAIVITTGSIAMAATDAVSISIYRLNEGDEILVSSTLVTGPLAASTTVLIQQLVVPDWYRVVLVGDDDNTTAILNYTISNSSISEILVHLALPDLSERMMNLVQGCRVIGGSSHIMNLVSDQNATGSWAGDQPEGSVMYTSYLRGASGANGFQKLTSQQGNEIMEFKKFNPYTYVTPEDTDDWEFGHPYTFNNLNQVTNVINKPGSDFHYTVVYLKSGGTAIASDPSRNVQMEFYWVVEYTSDGLWIDLAASPVTEDDVAGAVKVLASMENITHNPAFKEIMQTIGKYVRLSAPVLALLGPYGKAASVAATGIGEGMRMVGYRTKKTARPETEQEDGRGGNGKCRKVEEVAPGSEMAT